jgi:hypothetical protein
VQNARWLVGPLRHFTKPCEIAVLTRVNLNVITAIIALVLKPVK